jgi:hypothetical protein
MLFSALLFIQLFGQKPLDCLCQKNEQIVFNFQTNNKKTVSICSEKKDKYLVYRFGSKAKIELQYPEILDKNSWQKFELYSYFRGGGVQNAGVDEKHLSFISNGVKYNIYDEYTAETNQTDTGVRIELPTKTYAVKGILKTKKGDLSLLDGKVPKSDF